MNKRKIIILLILAMAVIGFTMSSVSAASTTVKVGKSKNLGYHDKLSSYYALKDGQDSKGVHLNLYYHTVDDGDDMGGHTYRLTKAKFYYKNKNGKVITRVSKSNGVRKYNHLYSKKIKGYTPYKIKVYYRKMTKNEKKINKKYNLF